MANYIQRAPRYDLELSLRFRPVGAQEWRTGRTSNISGSGVLFRPDAVAEEIALGTVLDLMFALAPEGQVASAEVNCCGPVVRRQSGEQDSALAIRFAHCQMGVSSEMFAEA